MRKSVFILVSTIMLFLHAGMYAQWRKPPLQSFGAKEGLNSGVRDIAQDSMGRIYLGTHHGMYIYDGNEFEYFGHDVSDSNSISAGHISDVFISQDQTVYLAIYDAPLNVFHPATKRFEKYNLPPTPQFNLNFIQCIAEDANGNIWMGANNCQLIKYDRKSKKLQSFSMDWMAQADKVNNQVKSIYIDAHSAQKIWLTIQGLPAQGFDFSGYGMVTFDQKTEKFERTNGAGTIHHVDKDQHYWAGIWGSFIVDNVPSENKYEKYSYEKLYQKTPEAIPEAPEVSKDIVSYQGQLLIATGDVLSFDVMKGFQFFYDYRDGKVANNLFVDQDNNLWIGRWDGLDVYDPEVDKIQFYSLSDMKEQKRIYPGRLIYQPLENCFYLIASTTNNYKRIYTIPHLGKSNKKPNYIETNFLPNAISIDSDHQIWVTGEGQRYRWDDKVTRFIPAPLVSSKKSIPQVDALITNEAGWTAGNTGHRIVWWHEDDDRLKEILLDELLPKNKGYYFSHMIFGSDNEILVTVTDRVLSINLLTGKSIELQFFEDSKIQLKGIGPISSRGKYLWISSLSTLYLFEKDGHQIKYLSSYSLKDGISSATIKNIFEDQHKRLWIFSDGGMDCLDLASEEIRSFSESDGLPVAEMDPIQVAETEDGHLATVCGNGLMIWHPDTLWHTQDDKTIKTLIKELQVNGQIWEASLTSDQVISYDLPKGPKVISANYQGLAFPTDRMVTYSYRLISRDTNWIPHGKNNQIILSDLPFGKNQLQIRANNTDDSAPATKIILNNPTPFWASYWFYLMAIILSASLIYLLYRRRIRMIENRMNEKAVMSKKMSELELTALRSQMNPHFMFNSLNSIKTYILEAQPDIAAEYLSKFSHLIRRILQNSGEQKVLLNEEIETLELYVSLEQFRFEEAFSYDILVDEDLSPNEIEVAPMLIQPFVENAIWHGLMHRKSAGRLTIHFSKEEGQVVCEIDDNGVGRKHAAELKSMSLRKHKSMGMSITKNRMELLNQYESSGIEMEIIDKEENGLSTGTTVKISWPLNEKLN